MNPYGLSGAELKVARCIIQGLNVMGCAQELYLSKRTVESHLNSIYRKLGIAQDPAIYKLVVAANMLRDYGYFACSDSGTISKN